MKRTEFLALGTSACAVSLFPLGALAWQPYAVLPAARAGLWIRYVMGFGVPYQKQIGFGIERTPISERYFIETQVGMPGGSCNPNTMKKAYLRTRTFGNLTQVYGIEAYVSRSSTLVMLDQDQPPPLRLLDSVHLYPKRGAAVTKNVASTVSVPRHAAHQSENSIVVAKTAVDCTQCSARFDDPLLKELEMWTSSDLPLGVGKMRARVAGMPPFELTIDSYGFDFHTGIGESLDAVRAQQS
ncbi:MAG TPA: hypothetical protein VJP85_12280 [Candidatus Baltobacteraceae bacterium]|nr:hypothetical protein [Candidatus Baltobacteraceae bacterium]